MNWTILILIGSQLLFTASDTLARSYMKDHGFHLATFFAPWFLFYLLLRMPAVLGQLYIFSSIELGKTMALFAVVTIILSNLIGLLLLKEVLSVSAYVGIALAITAFIVLYFSK
ncbi:MAG: hypothetical protein A2751_03065 [Candidatus Doudnabacteria bacterium RIFCSPHIGHO2_01_FULL_46_14]|uniref:EamA domain-containing protein n=1 Tax=Candidatus Doudnabacteria bacterium RIFCSPHIGHO2_01_FULL_46_14 TaxID=1817824 RepID=A0A1F5NK96_9BACT|nr:MAG: hypothetical protein A2751_03065 [Candidatus Doudnabacteria bacterium RIFCSPHIGHO2_01_FULL_46_14]